MPALKASSLTVERQLRNPRRAAMRENLNHAIHRVRSVERARRSVNYFNFVHAVRRQIRVIHQPARLIYGRAINQHLRVIGISAVEKKCRRTAAWSKLRK